MCTGSLSFSEQVVFEINSHHCNNEYLARWLAIHFTDVNPKSAPIKISGVV